MKTILLIEDNREILENLTEYLELEGYKILTANNGKSGLELAKEGKPDLIICDLLMPEMNGLEVLQMLLKTGKTSHIPFIFSSSMSEKIDRASAMKMGADDYITKPFTLESLLIVVKNYVSIGKQSMSQNM